MTRIVSRRFLAALVVVGVALAAPAFTADDWRNLFDGSTMDGWTPRAVHDGRGGIWTVADGALVADQDTDHTGGLLGTEETFSDFEIEVEFMADYPVDTGLFLRTREADGMGYQITIDYRDDGSVGSLYAPAEGGFLVEYPDWEAAYREDDWNRLRVRIEGQPAHITAWLNDVQTIDFTDDRERYPHEGYIGLQVHGGPGSWGEDSKARYRTIRVRGLE